MIKIHRDFGEGGRRKKLRLALVILVKLAKVTNHQLPSFLGRKLE
jgi:hypothetical protein